jgi:hypothetical protein
MKKTLAVAIAAVGLFLGAFTSNANAYVVNGDFSNPWGGSFTTYNAGGNFGGWNVDSGSVDLIGSFWQSATVGGGSVDMDGFFQAGAISQTLTTGAGNFVLNFSLSANSGSGVGTTRGVRVTVGDAVQDFFYTLTGANSTSNMNYIAQSLAFVTDGPTNLTFASLSTDDGAWGAVVSGVSVSAVPLPAALPMLFTSLLGMFGFKNFRRKSQLA